MRVRNIKLKPMKLGRGEAPLSEWDHESDVNFRAPLYDATPQTHNPDQNKQMLKVLTTLVKSMSKPEKEILSSSFRDDIQPRDRQVVVNPDPYFKSGTFDDKNLKKWAAEVFKKVFSASFNYFSKKQMNFEQAKIFCSENIIKNLVVLNERHHLNNHEFQQLDSFIEHKILHYIRTKYPQKQSTEVNKKLQQLVDEVDNIEALSNNYIVSSDVQFEYRDDGNYNDLIMRFINEVKDKIDLENKNEQTNYEEFQEFIRNVFDKVTDLDWMNHNDSKVSDNSSKNMEEKLLGESSSPAEKEMLKAFMTMFKKEQTENQEYKAEVKEYTHYLIGRKIPENTPNFTQKQIRNRNITMKSPTILRILTKWCSELWQKYDEIGYFTNRSESVKDLKGGNINTLLSWMRKWIDKRMQQEKEQIVRFMDELCDNNYDMQSKIIQMEIKGEQGGQFLEDSQKVSGKFCSKVVKNLHIYLIAYLNRLIHGLMKVSKQFFQQNDLSKYSFWPHPPNLLSFKISDLIRCKCSSKEREVIRIYRQIQRISRQNPAKFKIVRIKNRLEKGTNDILINVKFNNTVLCQIQLSINNQSSQFTKCSNLFQHYIYELQRSTFGPLTQLCSVWNALDQRTVIYDELIEQEYLRFQRKEHECGDMNMKVQTVRFGKSFICSGCDHTFFHNDYLRNHLKCKNCDYYICSNCQIQTRDEGKLIKDMIKDEEIKKHVKRRVNRDEKLPHFGICIFLERKSPKIQLFQYVKFQRNKKDYLFGKKQGKIYEIDKIKTKKMLKDFRNKHLVFEIDNSYDGQEKISKKEINKFILTQVMKYNYNQEKQSISLMGEGLTTQACREILEVGTPSEKENVKNLFLADNNITALPFNPEEFPQLFWLTISRNRITQFQGMDRFINLKNLNWRSGQLTEIPKNIYKLSTLKELVLSNNDISTLSPEISKFRNLRVMKLDNNYLSELPEEIGEWKLMTSLNLQGNQLKNLPKSLFSLERLEDLQLSSNYLNEIPDEICELKKLKELAFSKNTEISKFPQNFTQLEHISKLNCSSTNIQFLPSGLQRLQNMKNLNIENTKITRLTDDLSKLLKLENFNMANVKNLELGNQLYNLKRIKKLNIKGCIIDKLPNLTLLNKLETLDISDNNFMEIDEEVFGRVNALAKLVAFNNKFTIFPNIKKLQRLISLDLSSNKINQIPDLSKNNNLEELIMKNNELSCLPLSMKQLNRLRKLDLQGNNMEVIFDKQNEEEINNMETPVWPYLSFINLRKNKFNMLPNFICKCQKLEELYISDNALSKVPHEFSKLKNLWLIDAKTNSFEQIPPELAYLHDLTEVNFENNQIVTIPSFIQHFGYLQKFYVNQCKGDNIDCLEWMLTNANHIDFGNSVNNSNFKRSVRIRANNSMKKDEDGEGDGEEEVEEEVEEEDIVEEQAMLELMRNQTDA